MAQAEAATKPEFITAADAQAMVAAAVATALGTANTKNIPQTSIATRGTNPNEVSVQFRKWHAYGNTAYQKGQYAGFPIQVAEEMEKRGVVIIDPGFRREPAAGRMVRK